MSNNWESNAFLTSIIENIPHMIFVKDAKELKFVRFNKAGEELLGLSRQELLGKSDFDFFPKEQAEFFTGKDREVLASKTLYDIPEEPIDTPRGKRILHTKKIPILDGQGEPQFLLGISEDITEIKALRERVQQAMKIESIGSLAAGVAHEFNNILTAILFASGIIKDNSVDKKLVSDCATGIIQSVEKAGFLTKRLLSFSNQDISSPIELNLNSQIIELKEKIQLTTGSQIELALNLSADPDLISIDPGDLEQVILGLVQNATEAMPRGGTLSIYSVTTALSEQDTPDFPGGAPGQFIRLSVEDTGTGMDDETMSRLFHPFFTTKTRARHQGLGLATIYGIIHKIGGFLSVDSKLRVGTTMRVFFPIAKARSDKKNLKETETSNSNSNKNESKTIMVVEDEDAVRRLIKQVLERLNYKVIEAIDGVDALALARQHESPIDLLLTDIVMPRMGGIDLAKYLLSVNPELKVVLMSGYFEAQKAEDIFIKNHPFVEKPFEAHSLVYVIENVLNRAGQSIELNLENRLNY